MSAVAAFYPVDRPDLRITSFDDDGSFNTSQEQSSATSDSSSAPQPQPPARKADHRGSHEAKPRLSKGQQETLEAHFQLDHRPNSNTKKNFSESLDVSVEKINNWFQNRRAKLKGDNKKHEHMWSSQNPLPIHFQDSSYIDPSFYHNVNSSQASSVMFSNVLGPVPEQAEPTLGEDSFYQDPVHSGHMRDGYNSDPTTAAFFGLQNDAHQEIDSNAVTTFGDSFNIMPFTNSFHSSSAAANYMANGSLSGFSPLHLNTRIDQATENMSDIERLPSSSSMPSMTFTDSRDSSFAWPQSAHRESATSLEVRNNSTNSLGLQQYHSTSQANSPCAQIIPDMQHILPSQASISVPIQSVPQRRPSQHVDASSLTFHPSSSMPDISMRNTINDESLASSVINPEVSIGGTLAARRQRHPGTLGITQARSSSFGAAVHDSPTIIPQTNLAAPNSIRRIKSSIVMSGRIHKAGSAAAQRSPLHTSFKESSASKVSRQGSLSSLNNIYKAQPLSPLSPRHLKPRLSSETTGSARRTSHSMHGSSADTSQSNINFWSTMPNTADSSAASSVWTRMPSTSTTTLSFGSPPHTPMDIRPMEQLRIRQPSHPEAHPQPKWQPSSLVPADPRILPAAPLLQTEPISHDHFMGPGGVEEQTSGLVQNDFGQFFQPHSIYQQDLNAQTSFANPGIHETSQLMHDDHEQHFPTSQFFYPAQQQTNMDQSAGDYYNESSQQMTDLHIQQYYPRDPVSPSELPPKTKTLQREYSFQNQGPENFSSPSPTDS